MKKLLIIIVITIIIFITFIIFIILPKNNYPAQIKYGVTFSPRYARYLKLDWQKTYLQILDELKVKNLRIPSYWNSPLSDTDFMLEQAAKRGVRVVLVVGIRQPRWPECHIPNWARVLTVSQRQNKTLEFIQQIVERYKDNTAIWAWQVENEPMLGSFGQGCDIPDKNFLKSEVELVKKLDSRPIILTDSGELGSWEIPIKFSDISGISVYRRVYNPVLGYQTYPLTPPLYNLKARLFKSMLGKPNQKTIIAELQAEPWLSDANAHANPQKQHQLFSEKNLQDNVEFAKKVGFDEIYLWGVEWWYFMAQAGYPQYLDYAKSLF